MLLVTPPLTRASVVLAPMRTCAPPVLPARLESDVATHSPNILGNLSNPDRLEHEGQAGEGVVDYRGWDEGGGGSG